jgi:uncharacterized SAM-binding protein YcdF (DUF218 family)
MFARNLAAMLILAVVAAVPAAGARGQTSEDLAALNAQVDALFKAGVYWRNQPAAR